MNDILEMIDQVRRSGATPSEDRRLYRSRVAGNDTLITYCSLDDAEVERVVASEVARAQRDGATLEWDVFAHDSHAQLSTALLAAGFSADPKERVLAISATRDALESWKAPSYDIREVLDDAGI